MNTETQNQKFEEFMLQKSHLVPENTSEMLLKVFYAGGLLDGITHTLDKINNEIK